MFRAAERFNVVMGQIQVPFESVSPPWRSTSEEASAG